MLKIALIAYLCLTTVLGPALCCCNAQQLFSMAEGAKCCGERELRELPGPQPLAHCSHHGHAHHRHEKPMAKDSDKTDKLPPAGHNHDKQNCPCGEHHAKLVAAVTNVAHYNGGDLQGQTWSFLAVATPTLPVFDGHLAVLIAARPAHLYGREILRAHQIMRC